MPSANLKPRTLYDKVFDAHIVDEREDGTILLYIGRGYPQLMMVTMILTPTADRHLVHEVTSPVSNLMARFQMSHPNASDSKPSRASAMLVEESEDRTAPLLQLIMYSFPFSQVQIFLAELTDW